jgi:hypothetical protein
MTCWRRRIGSISRSAGAETHGNSAKAKRGEYDGAIISTQLTAWQRANNTAAVNADLAAPEVDNLTASIWFRRGRTNPRAAAADRALMLTRRSPAAGLTACSAACSLGPAIPRSLWSLSPFFTGRGRSGPYRAFAAGRRPPLVSMKPMMRSSPSLFFKLVITNGRSPRIRLASVSIFSSDAPT